MGNSAVTQSQVEEIRRMLLNNASINQRREHTGTCQLNQGFGIVSDWEQDDPIIFLASVSKVIILLEMAQALDVAASVPFTQAMKLEAMERQPLHVLDNYDLYGQQSLPVAELFYQVAAMSSNSATAAVKKLREGKIGTVALQEAYSQLAFSYQMLVSTENNHHWSEERPNTGRISEVATQLDLLVRRVQQGAATKLEQILANSLLNNEQDFGFCFTHSSLGRTLRNKGYQIYEKTGYYPAVTWIRWFAKQKWPTVMVQATVCTLISPEGEVTTFWNYSNTEVAYPWQTVEEEGIVFPNEWSEAYQSYIRSHKGRLDEQFRQNMQILVKNHIV